jgi:hypothetical protein
MNPSGGKSKKKSRERTPSETTSDREQMNKIIAKAAASVREPSEEIDVESVVDNWAPEDETEHANVYENSGMTSEDENAYGEEEGVVKITRITRLPQISEFGCFPPAEQYGKFRDWMTLVNDVLKFAYGWNERTKAAWFRVVCGTELRRTMTSFGIEATNPMKPFTSLVQAVAKHFKDVVDPAIDQQTFLACRQEVGESESSFYLRLRETSRHMDITEPVLRTHFVLSLRDRDLREFTVTMKWDINEVVSAATRKEQLKASEAAVATHK